MSAYKLIGRGVYSLPEAALLTRIPSKRIRRWMEGYSYVADGKRHKSPPAVTSSIGRYAGPLSLTFQDLIEVRFLDRFVAHGVSWKTIRIAAHRAKDLLSLSHPFSSRLFKTDGRDILAEVARPGGTPELLNLVNNQWELERIVQPMLYAGLDFNDFDEPALWWPLGKSKEVVIDPERSFGAPIVNEGSVRTSILATSAVVDGSQRMASMIYRVTPRAVKHAVAFEKSLRAA
jgi:hypothetical protein